MPPPLPVPPKEPVEVHPVLFAFPANVIGTLLPRDRDIPAEFHNGGRWSELVNRWFMSTNGLAPDGIRLPADVEYHGKPGISAEKAWRHVDACLRSYEPKHEHKLAGVAWLIDTFFSKVVIPSEALKEYS